MYKIKNQRNLIILLPALVSIIVWAISSALLGPALGLKFLGGIILIYTGFIAYAWIRTHNVSNMASTIYMLIFGLFLFSLPCEKEVFRAEGISSMSKVLLIMIYVFMIWLIYLVVTKQNKWWGREILELASRSVEENPGSFTERPRPTTRIDCTEKELSGFASFFEKRLLGLTYKRENKYIFLPLKFKNEFLALYSPNYNYLEKTWITVDLKGNVTVNISRKDYLDYREDLDFDKLCSGLGELFVEFFELYRSGLEVRIIDRMKAVGGGVFS